MAKFKKISDFWGALEAGMPETTQPAIKDMCKLVYYKALSDMMNYQHDVLGEKANSEEEGAAVLMGWHGEIEFYLSNNPMAKRVNKEKGAANVQGH